MVPAYSGEPNGAHFEATCIKGSAGAGPLNFAFTHKLAAAKIKITDKVPAAYRLIIDDDEVVRVSSGPTKMTTAAGALGYTFIWSVRLMSMIANAQKEIKMVFDGDPAPIAVPARGSGEAVRSFLQQCKYDLSESILACGEFGLISAPRLPQWVQVKLGSMSESRTSSGQPSALTSTWCEQR